MSRVHVEREDKVGDSKADGFKGQFESDFFTLSRWLHLGHMASLTPQGGLPVCPVLEVAWTAAMPSL